MKETKICAFGDSAMKGTLLESEKPLRYRLPEKSFTDLAADALGVEIDNYARFGSTVAIGEKMLYRHLARLPHFDYTLLKFGGNDCDFDWAAIAGDPSGRYQPFVPLTEFSIIYERLIGKLRASGSSPVMLTLVPLDSDRYFAHITRNFDEKGRANVLGWLGGTPDFIGQWHEMYSLQVRGIASKLDVPLIDIASPLTVQANLSAFLCEDGIHPNLKGQALMAEQLASGLGSILGANALDGIKEAQFAFC